MPSTQKNKKTKRALILVDIQNDFLPGGALAVKNGNDILPVVNDLLNFPFDLIVATKDWHPSHHVSFATTHNKMPGETITINHLEQILWPIHCIQGEYGAELSSELQTERIAKIIHKGTDEDIDSYSTFYDNCRKKSTGLSTYLKKHKIDELYLAGLATDYCVKYSVLDALHLGFKTFVIVDA
jgi:nicotinamidase/pyrazinamidase